MIIDIEGTDGSGKLTQTKKLFEYLVNKGYKCKMISFPNYDSKSSVLLKMYLNGEFGGNVNCVNSYQSSVFYAIDRFETMRQINIDDYDYILFDRYTPSNMIHQSTRIDDEKELNDYLDWLEDFEYVKLCLPKPDKILFLDMPAEFSIELARARAELKNGQARDIQEEDSTHLFKAYNRAKYVAEKYNWTTIKCVNKGVRDIEEIHQDILTKLGLK